MRADKFNCPKCGFVSTVTNTVVGKKQTHRYRHCRVCNINFATSEAVVVTPRLRQIVGEERALKLWGPEPFKYRKAPRKVQTKPDT